MKTPELIRFIVIAVTLVVAAAWFANRSNEPFEAKNKYDRESLAR